MKKLSRGMIILLVVLVVVVALVGSVFGSYNSLVDLSESVEGQRANIQTQLQRRNDLVPNLVNTVKGYASHESEVFAEVADARAKLAGGGSVQDLANADAQMNTALSRLLSITESYPELKADAQYTALMDELAGTENRIAVARKDYNDVANVYNKKIRAFPTVMFAGMLGFEKAEYFEASAAAQDAPVVDFSSK